MAERELELDDEAMDEEERARAFSDFVNAVDLASDQDQMTWIKDKRTGNRIAAVVPVDHVPEDDRRKIHSIAAELGRALPSERIELTVELLALYDRPRLPPAELHGEWIDVGPTEGGVTLSPPSSRDPEGQR